MRDPFRPDLLRGKTTVITGGGHQASVAPSRSDDEVTIDGGEALLSGQQFAGLAHLDRDAAKRILASLKPSK